MSHIFLTVLFILSLTPVCLEVDLSVPGFPEMALDLGVSEPSLQQSVAWNFVGFFLSTLLYGPFSDQYGRRPSLLLGVLLMTGGAWGCVAAPSLTFFNLARFVQGLGAGAPAVLVFTMIADGNNQEKAERLIGVMNAVLTLLMAGAPTLGSLLTHYFGWHTSYWVLALLSTVTLGLLFLYLPETGTTRHPVSWKSLYTTLKTLLQSKVFMAAAIAPSLLFAFYICFVVTAPLLYRHVYGASLLSYGLHQSSFLVIFALVSLFSQRFLNTFGRKGGLLLSMTLVTGASLGLLIGGLWAPKSPFLTTGLMALYSTGFALAYPLIFAHSLSLFPDLKGVCTSVIMSLRMLLCAGGVSLTSHMYTQSLVSIALPLALMTGGILICVVILRKSWKESGAQE